MGIASFFTSPVFATADVHWLKGMMSLSGSPSLGAAMINGLKSPLVVLPHAGDPQNLINEITGRFAEKMTFTVDQSNGFPTLIGLKVASSQCMGCPILDPKKIDSIFDDALVITFIPFGAGSKKEQQALMMATNGSAMNNAGKKSYDGTLKSDIMTGAQILASSLFIFDQSVLIHSSLQWPGTCDLPIGEIRKELIGSGFGAIGETAKPAEFEVGLSGSPQSRAHVFEKGKSVISLVTDSSGINGNNCRMMIYEQQ